MKILVLHGPNLNLLGKREPEKYGKNTLEEIDDALKELAENLQVELEIHQSNSESFLVEKIQQSLLIDCFCPYLLRYLLLCLSVLLR